MVDISDTIDDIIDNLPEVVQAAQEIANRMFDIETSTRCWFAARNAAILALGENKVGH